MSPLHCLVAALGTGTGAAQTADALIGPVIGLLAHFLGLRVMAPLAPKGTALQKHGGSQAGAVMGAALLNVSYF